MVGHVVLVGEPLLKVGDRDGENGGGPLGRDVAEYISFVDASARTFGVLVERPARNR